ncbi:MAG: DNRLRE domain-containing protein [Actinomycetota bacterium]
MEGSRATYTRALPHADLTYQVLAEGVKETVTLHNAAAPTHYRFLIDASENPGVRANRLPDGSWGFFLPAVPEPIFVVPAPYMIEAHEPGVALPPETEHVSLEVSPTDDGFALDLEIDLDWLADPARSFPIEVDPTILIQPSSQDAYWDAACGTCGAQLTDRLPVATGGTSKYRAAAQFDLAGIPANAAVSSARLSLAYNSCLVTCPTGDQIDVHRITQSWSYNSTSSQLAFNATRAATAAVPQFAGSMDWTVTTLVEDWLDGAFPNFGFLLKRNSEVANAGGPNFPSSRSSDFSVTPKLEITYTGDAVTLAPITAVHSDGAELSWTLDTGLGSPPFQKFEIHRSSQTAFSPSSATLLTTITDPTITTYRDHTAAPNMSFSYRIVANDIWSNTERVTLPADGQARLVTQPGPTTGQDTYAFFHSLFRTCGNYGRDDATYIGSTSTDVFRPFLSFALPQIPPDADITSATLSVYELFGQHSYNSVVEVHRVTRAWSQGSGFSPDGADCPADGVTWYESDGINPWTTEGGDFDAQVAASVTNAAGSPSTWDDFNVTPLVQEWVSGSNPNLGVVLKQADETLRDGNYSAYWSSDYTVSPSLRPKLSIDYVDGSHALGPTVAVLAPGPSESVSGTVTVKASATDDRRVDKVEFFKDAVSLSTDLSAPYEASWTTTKGDNGNHVLTARATDDAGNVTTSQGVTVSVRNADPPQTSITAPLAGATVSGNSVTVEASASADSAAGTTVTKVEFFFDGNRISDPDTTAPYSVSWDTLDPRQTAFDGTHKLTSRVYDSDGRVVTSAERSVTVANTTNTKYRATYQLDDPSGIPQALTYKPPANPTDPEPLQDNHVVKLYATNNSSVTWRKSDVVLRYRWLNLDGTTAATGTDAALAGDVRAGAKSKVITVSVLPPKLAEGVDRGEFILRLDLFDKPTGKFFAEKGNPPLDNPVIVNKQIAATALGLERYYHYDTTDLGAGMTHLVNVASGNSLVRWTPFTSPGRGLSTVVSLTYNSLEDKNDSPIGNNFSLGISSLSRFGLPLDIHPNKADSLAGRAAEYIEFTDSDGTTHRFTKNAGGGWDEPPGVHLYLRQFSTTDPTRKWALTRPDRVTFFYDDAGFPSFVEDRNGNKISFTYQNPIPPGEDPGGVKRRVTKITDAAGQGANPALNRSFDIDYWDTTEAKKPQVRGKIQSISDHSGSKLTFDYYDDGNLLRITQKGGTSPEGITTPDRTFVFTYTTSSGAGPAIPAAADRISPDPKTPNQSTRLYSVRDPRGKETTFTYFLPGANKNAWKFQSITDRSGAITSFSYDWANRVTTVSRPLNRTTKFTYDTNGLVTKVARVLDPLDSLKDEVTNLVWSTDRHLSKLTEPGGGFTDYKYNDNGYPTEVKVLVEKGPDNTVGTADDVLATTLLEYQNIAVDANDVLAKWKTGRQISHISQLQKKTDPKGAATAVPIDDFQWTFEYDNTGNLSKVIEPEGSPRFFTQLTYNADGTVATFADENGTMTGKVTTFNTYDANGLPTRVTDPLGHVTTLSFDNDGLLQWIQDPDHQSFNSGDPHTYRTYFYNDAFNRLVRQSTPKLTEAQDGVLIWSSFAYDENDNLISSSNPEASVGFAAADFTTADYDAMDRRTKMTNQQGHATTTDYDTVGRVTKATLPKGVLTPSIADDFATRLEYDPLDRVLREIRYDTSVTPGKALTTHYCYNDSNDVTSVTAPRADLPVVNCAGPRPAFTTLYTYDAVHRVRSVSDPLDHRVSFDYDLNGNLRATTNAALDQTTAEFDQKNLLKSVTEPFNGTLKPTTAFTYDGAGNLKSETTPRGTATTYDYDAANQLTRASFPSDAQTTAAFVHRFYDPNGNLSSISLPVGIAAASQKSDIPDKLRSDLTYFDTGWIRTQDDHVDPKVTYDHTPEGWQSERTLSGGVTERWTHFPDGMLARHDDDHPLGSQFVTFDYDADNLLTKTEDRAGLNGAQKPVFVEVSYDSLNRASEVRNRKDADSNWSFTTFAYDLNSNVVERGENGFKSVSTGLITTPAKRHTFTYDAADWLDIQRDFLPTGCQKVDNDFTVTGWESRRTITAATTVCGATPAQDPVFSPRQTTTWDYFKNGKLKTLQTSDAAGAAVESHTIDYVTGGTYMNGHRVSDRFFLAGPNLTQCHRSDQQCTATYSYDRRDRLVSHFDGHGGTTTYELDPRGNITTETKGTTTRTFVYEGDRLAKVTVGGATPTTSTYLYKSGDFRCIAKGDLAPTATCPTDTSALIARYSFDYLHRLTTYESFRTDGTLRDNATYDYDALDRVVKQTEAHRDSRLAGASRTTNFTYLGPSNLVTREDLSTGGAKTYAYDAYGKRMSISDRPSSLGTTTTFTYAYDTHGSTSLLLNSTGGARVSYGYTPYGDRDTVLTKGATTSDVDPDRPLNPYTYSAKRFDSGSKSLDMGARRFGPDVAHFLTPDFFRGALSDLSLTTDPLTANRFGLAGGNPISYAEWDGHRVVADGTGSASRYSDWTGGRTEGQWAPSVEAGARGEIYGRPLHNPSTSLCPVCGKSGTFVPVGGTMREIGYVPVEEETRRICVFLGPCAVYDALKEGNILGAGIEAAGLTPWGRVGKLLRGGWKALASILGRADDAADVARATRVGGIFRGLSAIRSETGAAVAARLEVNGSSYVGTNLARGNAPIKGTFSFFAQHAEGDAFAQALRAGDLSGQSAALYVTRAPCRFCVSSLSAVARSSGLSELSIFTPEGVFGIYTPETGLVRSL